MAHINLRPWRDELRAEKQKEFLTTVAAFAILGVIYIILMDRSLNSSIEQQQGRNNFMQGQIATLNDKIKEIQDLRKRREQLIERMTVIQGLQGNRPVIVHVFDEMVRTLPDGVFYSELDSKGTVLSIEGTAESNNRISSLMRKLDSSEWFSEPSLTDVNKASEEEADTRSVFNLSVKRKGVLLNGQGDES